MSSEVLFPSNPSEQHSSKSLEGQLNQTLEAQLEFLRRVRLESMQGGGKPETSRPYSKPSFFLRLRSIEDPEVLVLPGIADVFPEEEFTAFSLFHGIETDHAQALFRGESYSEMIRGGLLHRLWARLQGFDHIENHREYDVAIPVGELHAPNVPEAKGFFAFGQTLNEQTSLYVSIAGLGAGGSISQEVSFQSDLEVLPGECAGLVCNADILIGRWENKKSQSRLDLLEGIDPDPWVYAVPLKVYPALDKAEDICLNDQAYSLLWERVRRLKLRRRDDFHTTRPSTGGQTNYTVKIKDTDEYSAKCLLAVKALGVEVGCEVKSHFTETTEFKYKLPPYYDYIAAYRGAGRQPLTWGADKMDQIIEDGNS